MANLSIAKIGQKIFNHTPSKTVAKSTNPFAASTFKGNVLTADVFETKSASKNKLTMSAFVGSIGDAFPTYRKAVESVVAFGNRIKENVSSIAHKINEIGNIEVSVDFAGAGKAIKSSFSSMLDKYSVRNLYNRYDEASLGKMLGSELSMNVIG